MEQKEIFINNGKNKITIIYDRSDSAIQDTIAVIQKGYQKAKAFFQTEIKKDIVVSLVYSRKEYNKKRGQETPPWNVGFTNKFKDKIFIFSPSVVNKYSDFTHKDIFKTIEHEVVHLFTGQNGFIPWWLDEGIAIYIANQKPGNGALAYKKLYESSNFLDFSQKNYDYCMGNGGYAASKFIFDSMLENFGPKKLSAIINSAANYNNFPNKFEEIIGQSLNNYLKGLLK